MSSEAEETGVHVLAQGRKRRTFTEAFKAEAIECCMQLGVSTAAVARAYDLHPNLLRRWVLDQQRRSPQACVRAVDAEYSGDVAQESDMASLNPSFVPVHRAVQPVAPTTCSCAQAVLADGSNDTMLRVEMGSGAQRVTVHWPAARHRELAQWLRDVLV